MAGQWMMILIGASLWMTCSAAPTECHFNSQGETNLFITRMQMCLETKSFHYQIDCSVQRAQVQYSILITWMSCLLRQSRQPSEIRWCRYNVIWTTCTHCSLERIIWLINAVSYALVISPSTKTNVKALCYLLNASFWKLKPVSPLFFLPLQLSASMREGTTRWVRPGWSRGAYSAPVCTLLVWAAVKRQWSFSVLKSY